MRYQVMAAVTYFLLSLPCVVVAKDVNTPPPSLFIVGYLPHYRVATWNVDQLGPVTDLIFFGATPTPDGGIATSELTRETLAKLMEAKRKKHCRVLLCVGGWERSSAFAGIAADPAKRTRFADQLQTLCLKHHLDGIDLDWEHPRGDRQLEDYVALLTEARRSLHRHALIITVAQASWQKLPREAYTLVHRVHLMSYDHEFPQATLPKTKADVARLLAWGCAPEKIALGIPFYGRDKNRRAKTYAELTAGQEITAGQDLFNGFAFNGVATIGKKLQLVDDQNLAGIMLWELGQDDYRSRNSLLRAIEAYLQRPHARSPK